MFSIASVVSLGYCLVVVVFLRSFYLLLSKFWWNDINVKPSVHYREDSQVCEKIFKACSTLQEKYTPPLFWGTNGHLQTIVFALIGRFFVPYLDGERHTISVPDGTTVTYDVYKPPQEEDSSNIIYIVIPGIGNSSANDYIRAFVHYTITQKHSVVILNHVGAIKDIPLTGNRLFTYGGTGDMAALFQDLLSQHPTSKFVAVGFSMGANIVVRFIGEREEWRKHFICAISVCQGYDSNLAFEDLSNVPHINKLYINRIGTRHLSLIRHHRSSLLGESPYNLLKDTSRRHNDVIHNGHDCNGFALDPTKISEPDEARLWSATTLNEVDEYYTRRVMGFETVYELWHWMSCVDLMKQIKDFPLLMINAHDDPVVPSELHAIPIQYTDMNPYAMFVTTQYGGHLGFFEGGVICPNNVTWVDRLIIQYSNACARIIKKQH